MKKLFFILLCTALATGVMAQITEKKEAMDKKKTEKELKKAIIEKKEEKKEVGEDLKHLKIGKAIKDRKDVRAYTKKIHRKGKHLRKHHGVKRPIHKSQKEIREEKKD